MPLRFKSVPALALVWFLGTAPSGCTPPPSTNSSPTSEEDPVRYQKAVTETKEKARRDREAERNAFARKKQAIPGERP
jgi:hypothetical protein